MIQTKIMTWLSEMCTSYSVDVVIQNYCRGTKLNTNLAKKVSA